MREIKTTEAAGYVLCHDITRIIKDVVKDTAFRKGHIITEEDIPVLLSLGKDHIYVWEKDERMLHEDEAAEILREICQNKGMRASRPKEGKIELTAETDGLFLADLERLRALNSRGEMMVAARPSGFAVKKGDRLCGMRVIPLVIEKEKMQKAREEAGPEPIFKLIPFQSFPYGLVTTGNEVYHGRIQDTFTPVIRAKMEEYPGLLLGHRVVDDNPERIASAIRELFDIGAQMVLCTGGMSVDPDDKTPLAIRMAAGNVISYGAPVLPGAMFMLAYTDDGRPICGLPGCVMYAGRTIFDLVLPYLLAGVPVTKELLAGWGNGGLCLNCPECHFPNCGFGKGV